MTRASIAVMLTLTLVAPVFSADPPTSLPAAPPMPRAVLKQIHQRELGDLFKPADADQLYRAHELVEQYFVQSDARAGIVRQLQGMELAAPAIGRLVRIRINWPELLAGVYYINDRVGPHDVRYFLGIPKAYDRTRPWPVVIKLPEADAFVGNPQPDPLQVNQIYTGWMTQELTAHPDAVVIMPLLNLDELWGPSYTGMNNALQPVFHATERVNLDPARIYLIGHAMSAHAVWNLALHYPTYFAAFNALAGSATQDWQRLRLMNLRNVLPVAWHDTDDPMLKIETARQLINALRIQKVPIDYLETRNVGHVPSDEIALLQYNKMRARTRELYPKQLAIQSNRPDTVFNRNDWIQIYQPMNGGEEKHLFFARGTGYMTVLAAAYSAMGSIEGNTIALTTRNVQSMRIYLNDQMVDLSLPVRITLNGRERFNAIVGPNIDQMLKDQLFLGRGWRYYTAVLDVDNADIAVPAAPTTRKVPRRNDDE